MQDFHSIRDEIRRRIDLVEVVAEHVALKRSGADYAGLCPFHQEKTPSFHVNPDRGIFHCFGCKAGGDLFRFVELREGVGFGDAVRILADRAGVEFRGFGRGSGGGHGRGSGGRSPRTRIADANGWAAAVFRKALLSPAGQSARDYLTCRGIDEQLAERFQLGLAVDQNDSLLSAARLVGAEPDGLLDAGLVRKSDRGSLYDTFRDRLMFPIRDVSKRVVGFGGRALGDHPAKYINTSQNELFDKGRLLFGLDLARSRIVEEDTAIVVEGYTDCIACHQYGFETAVATLGTAMTEDHAALLRRYGKSVVLIFDSDDAGEAAAERAVGIALRSGLSVRLAVLPGAKDPADFLGEFGAAAFAEVLKGAVDALHYLWSRMCIRFDGEEGNAGRQEAVAEFAAKVAELSQFGAIDPIQQGLIANQIAKLLQIPSEHAHRLLVRLLRQKSGGLTGGKYAKAATSNARSMPARPAPMQGGGEQGALSMVLEALLNEPGLFASVADVFDAGRFSDPVKAAVAKVLIDMATDLGEFGLVELLDRLSNAEQVRVATESAIRGQRMGNFAATVDGAAATLRRLAVVRETSALRDGLSREAHVRALGADADVAETVVAESGSGADAPDRLAEIQRRLKEFQHFAPRSRMVLTKS